MYIFNIIINIMLTAKISLCVANVQIAKASSEASMASTIKNNQEL